MMSGPLSIWTMLAKGYSLSHTHGAYVGPYAHAGMGGMYGAHFGWYAHAGISGSVVSIDMWWSCSVSENLGGRYILSNINGMQS